MGTHSGDISDGPWLVAVPRKLYQNVRISGRLRRIQGQAPRIYNRLNDANFALEELEAQLILLRQRKHAISRDHQGWIEEICHESILLGSHISIHAQMYHLRFQPSLPIDIWPRCRGNLFVPVTSVYDSLTRGTAWFKWPQILKQSQIHLLLEDWIFFWEFATAVVFSLSILLPRSTSY